MNVEKSKEIEALANSITEEVFNKLTLHVLAWKDGSEELRKADFTKAAEAVRKLIVNNIDRVENDRLQRIEDHLAHMFLIGNCQYLEQRATMMSAQLQKIPGDIHLMSELQKIANDHNIVEPEMRKLNCQIWKRIEESTGKELKHFSSEIKPPKLKINV